MIDELVEKISMNITRTQERISQAAERSERDVSQIRLVVVTKAQPVETVQAAVQAGARILGENYPEESVAKIEALAGTPGLEWHMIGHVQSRKAALVAAHFDLVHSLDSLKLAERYERFAEEEGRVLPVLLEVNLGGEESKTGWAAVEEETWGNLLPDLVQVMRLPHLDVRGLMTMPPLYDDPEMVRPIFKKMIKLQRILQEQFPEKNLKEISMGTSSDFEVAVEEGATLVRVGTAILGPRPKKVKSDER